MKQHKTKLSKPTAFIAVNRNKLKVYNDKNVYLKSGTNFEIELFNPESNRILAEIEIDGNPISSSGIVINPGQRIYLERWLNDQKKFHFSTYEIDKSSDQAIEAIKKNGLIKIKFHKEQIKNFSSGNIYVPYIQPYVIRPYVNPYTQPIVWYGSSGTGGYSGNIGCTVTTSNGSNTTISKNIGAVSTTSTSYNVDPSQLTYTSNFYCSDFSNSIETGRTEHGEKSNQDLTEVFGDFEQYCSWSYECQILPESRKPIESDKIRSYCSHCGTRVRSSSWNFCPSCNKNLKED